MLHNQDKNLHRQANNYKVVNMGINKRITLIQQPLTFTFHSEDNTRRHTYTHIQ